MVLNINTIILSEDEKWAKNMAGIPYEILNDGTRMDIDPSFVSNYNFDEDFSWMCHAHSKIKNSFGSFDAENEFMHMLKHMNLIGYAYYCESIYYLDVNNKIKRFKYPERDAVSKRFMKLMLEYEKHGFRVFTAFIDR